MKKTQFFIKPVKHVQTPPVSVTYKATLYNHHKGKKWKLYKNLLGFLLEQTYSIIQSKEGDLAYLSYLKNDFK